MKRVPWGLVVLLLVVASLWYGAWTLIEKKVPEPAANDSAPYQNRGQFGDMFGAITSLFSALGFAGVLYTVWLQTKELEANRLDQVNRDKRDREQARLQAESTKALQESNLAIQEQLKISQDQARENSAPVFTWGNCTHTGFPFINNGGSFKILRVIPQEPFTANVTPCGAIIRPKAKGILYFHGAGAPMPKTFWFQIEYQSSFDTDIKKFEYNPEVHPHPLEVPM